MSTGPLEALLRCVELPSAVAEDIVMSYRGHYARALVRNRSVGDAGALLLSEKISHLDLSLLLSWGNGRVLDEVLTSRESRNMPLLQILSTWWLSPRDQQRLVNRRLSGTVINAIWQQRYMQTEIFDLLSEWAPNDDDAYLDRWFVEPECVSWMESDASNSRVRTLRESWGSRFDTVVTVDTVLDVTTDDLLLEGGLSFDYRAALGRELANILGEGEGSRGVWLAFFDLLSSTRGVKVGDVVNAARRVGSNAVWST